MTVLFYNCKHIVPQMVHCMTEVCCCAADAAAVAHTTSVNNGVQSKDVVVYRLVTCGTVEEKIYRKQVR